MDVGREPHIVNRKSLYNDVDRLRKLTWIIIIDSVAKCYTGKIMAQYCQIFTKIMLKSQYLEGKVQKLRNTWSVFNKIN